LTDPRVHRFAHILVDHSARIQPGDRVLLEATTAAVPLLEALYEFILQRGGHPYLQMEFPNQRPILIEHGSEAQLTHVPQFYREAYEQFESRIRIHSLPDPKYLDGADPDKYALFQGVIGQITAIQFRRGAAKEFKWVTTLFPTAGYAREAGMTLEEYEDFFYRAVHAHEEEKDPLGYWNGIKEQQQRIVDRFNGHDMVAVRGPDVDLTLSVKDRVFINCFGDNNMPDGEVFTGPVEGSVNGWVRFTYPSERDGHNVEGVELHFKDGEVVKAQAKTNEEFLLKMIAADDGARRVGEFAIGNNFEIDRVTGNTLFDEKIGGSFHMALGAGYPESGSQNKSAIHWDMICDMRTDSEITMDGETVYRDGKFVF
jgi:aminopeptidase